MNVLDQAIDNTRAVTNKAWEAGKTIYFAGLGTLSIVEENSTKMLNTLIEKGQGFETPKAFTKPEKLNDFTARLKHQGQQLEEQFQTILTKGLHRVGIPSRDEVQTLIDRVEALTKKIETLKN